MAAAKRKDRTVTKAWPLSRQSASSPFTTSAVDLNSTMNTKLEGPRSEKGKKDKMTNQRPRPLKKRLKEERKFATF
jgi:hypothetical protein